MTNCQISIFNYCLLIQETFKSPIFNFGDIDISNDTFVYKVFRYYGSSENIFPINFIDDNTVYIEDIKMPLGDYQHELSWTRNGVTEVVFQGQLKVTNLGNNCGCTSNNLNIKVVNQDVVVNIAYSERIIERITDKGPQGDSAYHVAVENGFVGTESEWLESLKLHYSDLTEAEILELQQPAIEAAQTANTAADNANSATQNAISATNEANTATINADNAANTANTSATNADNSAGLANTAANNANEAATAANTAAEFANSQRGWTPIHTFEADGVQRQVKKLTDYIGGTGDKPTQNIGQYVLDGGYTTDKSLATNFKGEQSDNLILEYVHSGNKEVPIQSIDYSTNTFYAPNHGLNDGTSGANYIAFNYNGLSRLNPLHFPYNSKTPLYVINATQDTFQLSNSVGGASIVLINQSTVDVTKWHLEQASINSLVIDDLGGGKAIRLLIEMRVIESPSTSTINKIQEGLVMSNSNNANYNLAGRLFTHGQSLLGNYTLDVNKFPNQTEFIHYKNSVNVNGSMFSVSVSDKVVIVDGGFDTNTITLMEYRPMNGATLKIFKL